MITYEISRAALEFGLEHMYYLGEMKYCPGCREVKPRSAFAQHAGRVDGLQPYCKECRGTIDHERYERRVGRQVPRSFQRSERGRKAWLRSLKERRPCTDCGRVFPRQVMQWDYKPGFEKLGEISVDFWGRTRDEVLAEIAKCDLVCANCHAVRTFARAPWGLRWLREEFEPYDSSSSTVAA